MANIVSDETLEKNWLGRQVKIKLFGKWREGVVVETLCHLCAIGCIVEMQEGNKQIKVLASIQALKRI